MNEKKNILFLLHVPPPVHGSSMVGKAIMESKLINSSFDCRYINLLMSRTISETGKPGLMKLLRFAEVWFRLLKEIIRQKPDLCYLALTATGAAFYKDVFLVVLLKIFRVKRVFHLHNKGIRQNSETKANHLLYRFVFKHASVILLSGRLFYEVDNFLPVSGVFICPNGITENNVKASSQPLKPRNVVRILFLSNLSILKGVFVLLNACAILHDKKLNFECRFVGGEGDINREKFNQHVSELGLTGCVDYPGPLFGKEKQQAFAEADIFAFPTCYETFGLVNLEAMQNQLPVVSTMEGGIPDVVENGVTGYLIPVNDTGALAEKLEILIKNPETRKKMGKAGRQKYEKEFTLKIFEKNINNILHKITEQQ